VVLGQTFLTAYYTIFDMQRSEVGFAAAAASCYYGYSQQPGKVLDVSPIIILVGSLALAAIVFGGAVVIILRNRKSEYVVIQG